MRPKLWDGANAVGEAKERALQTVDAPYLTAAGQNFTARKQGAFAEVTGVTPAPPDPLDGWVSTSDGNYSPVVFTGAESYRITFRKRGTIETDESGFAGGTNLQPDGKGDGFTSTFSGIESDYAIYPLCSAKGGGRRIKPLIDMYNFVSNASRTGLGAAFLGSGLRHLSIGGYPVSVESTTQHWYDGDVTRSEPAIALAYKASGVWGSSYIQAPRIASEDCACPVLSIHTPARISLIYAHNIAEPPMLYYSNDLGGTWSGGVSVLPLFSGYTFHESPLETEATLQAENPTYPAYIIRNMYLNQSEAKRILRSKAGMDGMSAAAISQWRVVIVTKRPYWNGSAWVCAAGVYDVRSGQLSRTEFPAEENHFLALAPIGKFAWTLVMANASSEIVFRKVTFDGGDTYLSFPAIPGHLGAMYPIKPYAGEGVDYRIMVTGREGGLPYIYTTDDFETFKRRARLASSVEHTDTDFVRAIHLGTREAPAPLYTEAPWSRDDKVAAPAWWTHD